MKRTIPLLSLFAIGCAHSPVEVARTETVYAADSVRIIREAVREELLGARPSGVSLDMRLVGAPHYLGVIDYTGTSKTNHEATTPFNNTSTALCGKVLLIHATTAAYIVPVATNTGTVTTVTGVPLQANERVVINFEDAATQSFCWLAVIRSSVSGNLSVWELF